MKTINKIASLLGVCLLLGFAACTEKVAYSPAELPGNAQVYFPSTLASKVALSQDLTVTSFNVQLNRIDKTNALTVNLASEVQTLQTPGIFNIPASASFAAGADTTHITITYDPSKMVYDVYDTISISVSDQSATSPYGSSTYTFAAGIPAPWKSLGKATFTDTWMFSNSYSIEIQQHLLDPTRFRLVDPYTPGLNAEGYVPDYNKGDQSPYLEFQVLPAGSVYKGVTTTVNGLVVYGDINTGYYNTSNGYNQDVWEYHPSRFTKYATENFWVHNIVTQFSADGVMPDVVQLAPYFYMTGIGGWDYTQNDGVVTIVFPGVVLADYSAKIAYSGRFVDASDSSFAVANVTLGKDVEYAKVALVPGDLTDDALNGIVGGSIASVQITTGGTVQLPCSSAGKYTFVVVTYANDEAKDYNSASFNFTTGDAAVAYPIEDFYGDYVMSGLSAFDDSPQSMPVTIAAGDSPNTLVITGLQYAASVTATFPVKGYMSIAPQQLADYGQYDIALQTIMPDWSVSESPSDAIIFTRLESGDIILTPDSYAMGYLLNSDVAGGYVDGYYNISFSPATSSASSTLKATSGYKASVSSVPIAKSIHFGTQAKGSERKTVIAKKGSVNKAIRNKMKLTFPF